MVQTRLAALFAFLLMVFFHLVRDPPKGTPGLPDRWPGPEDDCGEVAGGAGVWL